MGAGIAKISVGGGSGSQGAQGPQGYQGFQGTAGSNGTQGPQGYQGFQGMAGSNGTQGAQGAAGANGAQGAQGSTGTTGPQGATGATGAQGAQGSTGVNPSYYTGAAGPAGGGFCLFETMSRALTTANNVAVSTGVLQMTAVYVPSGTVISELGYVTGNTAATTPLHQWIGLYDNNRNQLAVTADQTTAAIATGTAYQYPIATVSGGAASSFTTTYSGLYYVGVLIVASVPPTLRGSVSSSAATGITPIFCGTTGAAITIPPAFPYQAAALASSANVPYVWGS